MQGLSLEGLRMSMYCCTFVYICEICPERNTNKQKKNMQTYLFSREDSGFFPTLFIVK